MNVSQNKIEFIKSGNRLKELRQGVKKELFAEFLGISVRTYYRYEKGERKIPIGLMKLAESDQWTIAKKKQDKSLVSESDSQFDLHGGWQPPDIEDRTGFPEDHEFWRAYKLLSEIYESGDDLYVRAIFHNLVAFNNAINLKQEMQANNERIESIENIVKTMDRRTGKDRRKVTNVSFTNGKERRKTKNRRGSE